MKTKLIKSILVLGLFFSLGFKEADNALGRVFPGARIEVQNIVLTQEQANMAKKLSGVELTTRLVSFYIAKKGDETIGYAYIDSHIVRVQPETVLFVISPEGTIESIEILHSDEPEEYRPGKDWLGVFKGKSLDKDPIRFRRDISGITGATITARAITDNTRKVLAIWKVIFDGKPKKS